jgi:hypothetical protein
MNYLVIRAEKIVSIGMIYNRNSNARVFHFSTCEMGKLVTRPLTMAPGLLLPYPFPAETLAKNHPG